MRRIFFAALSCFVLCGLMAASNIARADKVYGAVLLNEARKIGPGRYQSMKDYQRTLRFFRKVHGRVPGVVIRRMNTTPKVKGVHISNLRPGRTWDGINIYETGRKVFIYVIKSDVGTGEN
jgi:hypothetical protein